MLIAMLVNTTRFPFVTNLALMFAAALLGLCVHQGAPKLHALPRAQRLVAMMALTLGVGFVMTALHAPQIAAMKSFLYSCMNWWSDYDVFCWL